VTATRTELLEASDETIEDAVQFADPIVLRGLLYQLTGDEALVDGIAMAPVASGLRSRNTMAKESDAALIRAKAADFLKGYRDAGAGEIPPGPESRLQRSLSLTAGAEVPLPEMGMWVEQLALDPFARGLEWSTVPSPQQLAGFSVIVIGAGMGGLNAAAQLDHAGISFTILEKNPEVGGTWWENRYPGARVDTPSRTYTHVLGADFPYPSAYCQQSENEKYINWIADHFNVRKNIVFNTEVSSIVWDDSASRWHITAETPDGERTWDVNAVITAVGFLSRPNVPHVDGQEEFTGPLFHTARWPAQLDLTGKRVAVAGSGCTGYQLTAELAKDVGHLYLFQRKPNWVFDVPGYLAPYPPQVNWLDRNFPYLVNFIRFANSWANRPGAIAPANEIDPDFDDPFAVSQANKQVRDQRIAFMQSKFAGRPDLMEKMLPPAPPLSARPVLVDRAYSVYDALLQDNVTLVTEGITRLTESGVLLQDGSECPVDAVVLATGFRANDFLWPMEVRGRGGIRLEDLWSADGARAYLGNMLPGFPNFFMLYGPNTNANVGFAAIHLEELVTRFALECLDALITGDRKSVEVKRDAYERYNAALDVAASTKVYLDPRARNYYKNDFGRSSTNGAFDARLLWEWLRDPHHPGRFGQPRPGEPEVMQLRSIISPYFGEDLVLD
jgi:4-hydroxyacetophenone monooxygenase